MREITQDDNLRHFSFSAEGTYAESLHHLMQNASANQPKYKLKDGSEIYRPLTFKENMEARLENSDLFEAYLDSSTSIAYKKDSPLVKLNPISEELLTLPKDFNRASLDINYQQIDGEELDTSRVSKQDLWLVAMGGNNCENKDLYNMYKQVLYQRTAVEKDQLMRFCTIYNDYSIVCKSGKDKLLAVGLVNDDSNSDAIGNEVLDDLAMFLLRK